MNLLVVNNKALYVTILGKKADTTTKIVLYSEEMWKLMERPTSRFSSSSDVSCDSMYMCIFVYLELVLIDCRITGIIKPCLEKCEKYFTGPHLVNLSSHSTMYKPFLFLVTPGLY